MSEKLKPCPVAKEQNKKDGWTFDYKFIDSISRRTRGMGFYAGMEEVDAVLIVLRDDGHIASEDTRVANEARIRQEVIEVCVQTCLKLHNSMLEAGNVICSNGVTHCITALHALKEAPCQSEK